MDDQKQAKEIEVVTKVELVLNGRSIRVKSVKIKLPPDAEITEEESNMIDVKDFRGMYLPVKGEE